MGDLFKALGGIALVIIIIVVCSFVMGITLKAIFNLFIFFAITSILFYFYNNIKTHLTT